MARDHRNRTLGALLETDLNWGGWERQLTPGGSILLHSYISPP